MNIKDTETFKLAVTTSDKASEVYIIDGNFSRVAKSIGDRSVFELPKGLYSVKVKVGATALEKPVTLLGDQTVNFEPVPFSLPQPLQTPDGHSELKSVAHQMKSQVNITLGAGSGLFIAGSNKQGGLLSNKRQTNSFPTRGLTLRDTSDKIIFDFEKRDVGGILGFDTEEWAAYNIHIDAGTYCLCVQMGNGELRKQTIIASSGWQTQVFLQTGIFGSSYEDAAVDLAAGSLFMLRLTNTQNDDGGIDYRLTEQLRLALKNRRNVANEELLHMLFEEPLHDPMFVLYMVHMLLQPKDRYFQQLQSTVTKLRVLLGNMHPDVEAIALKLGMESLYRFREFPMMANSWNFVMEASAQDPELVPHGSAAYHLAGEFWSCDLWLIWGKQSEAGVSNATKYLQNTVRNQILADKDTIPTERVIAVCRKFLSDDFVKGRLLRRLPGVKMAMDNVLRNISRSKLLSISEELGIPPNKVEELLGDLDIDKIIEGVINFNTQSSIDINADPQKGKWGGRPEVNFRRLSAVVEELSAKNLFKVTLTLSSLRSDMALTGTVTFHLHDTFLNAHPIVPVKNGTAVLVLPAVWGSFTVGAEADGGSTRLELDLAELPGVTDYFKTH